MNRTQRTKLRKAARALMKDAEHWITVHPNGKGNKGSPVLINGAGQIIGGAGGKLNGKFVKPKSKSAERPGTEPQHAPAIWLGPPSKNPEKNPPRFSFTPPGGPQVEKPKPKPVPKAAPKQQEAPKQAEPKQASRKPFTPAKTSKEAAKFAVENGLVKQADFGKLNVEVANAANESLQRHIEDFPELSKTQDFVGSMQAWQTIVHAKRTEKYIDQAVQMGYTPERAKQLAKMAVKKQKAPSNSWAYATRGAYGTGVAFNEKYAGKDLTDFNKSLKYNVESKFHPVGCDTVKSIYDHEYGHQLDYLLDLRSNQEVQKLRFEAYGGKPGDPQYNGVPSSKTANEAMTNNVSKYACQNIAEFIAECWAEALNNPNPRPTATKLAAIVRSEYAKKFGSR